MSGFIKKLFSKPKPESLRLSIDEVEGYLDGKEKEAALIVETAAGKARTVCIIEMRELLETVHEIEKKEVRPDSHPHPKVRTVAEKSIPRFVPAMEKTLSRELTSDPELLYDDIVDLITSLAEATRKHGRYIAVVFPEDMKAVKSSLDIIGNALNTMTEEVKPAVNIRTGVLAARQIHEKINSERAEYDRLATDIVSFEDDIRNKEAGIEELEKEIATLRSGEEYLGDISTQNRIAALREELGEIDGSFEHLRSSCMNVFRKSAYIAEKEGNTVLAKDISKIMELLESPEGATQGAAEAFASIYPLIRAITDEHEGILKNSDEAELFSSAELFPRRLGDILSEHERVKNEIDDEETKLAGSRLPAELKSLESEMDKLRASISDLEEKITKSMERRSEIGAAMPGRFEDLRSVLAGLEGAAVELKTGWDATPDPEA